MSRLSLVRGRDVCVQPEASRRLLVRRAARLWRARGFPHYVLTDSQIVTSYTTLRQTSVASLWQRNEVELSPVGQPLATLFQRGLWSVPVYKTPTLRFWTPEERFRDPTSFKACLSRAPRIWPDRFVFRPSTVRRALMTFPNTASAMNFRPTAARAIYGRFSGRDDPVLDFSAGFGGRLLGALSLDRRYAGIEPTLSSVRGMHAMVRMLGRLGCAITQPSLLRGCAEELLPTLPGSSFPLIFTSPPYYSKERYSLDATQSYRRYPTYDHWRRGFLALVIRESHRLLERRGTLILNISNVFGLPIIRDAMEAARTLFRLQAICHLRLGKLPYIRYTTRAPFKLEPLLILRKR